jgi:putative SOS response-associated peptidase YedK
MCARFTLRSPADLLAVRFGLLQPPDLNPRFNIAPSQLVPVIGTKAGGHGRGLAMFKLGFVPHWAQGDAGKQPVNARAETVATTPMFADSFRLRRCIVPADGFYEWKTANKKKMPVHFRLKSH